MLRLIFPYINAPYPSVPTGSLILLIRQVEVVVACCFWMVPLLTAIVGDMYLYMFKLHHYLKGVFVGEGIFFQT